MPALVSPALVSPGLSSTSSPARARQTEEPQGRSFHAALDRSRASQANTDASDPTDSATARPGTPRRGASAPKDDTLPQIPNLDFFVPAVSAQVTTAAARTGAEAATAAALRGAATATERTDVQAALAGTDTMADAAKAVTEPDLPTAEAAAKAALADGAPADAATAEALRAAAGKTSTAVSAQADAAAATAKADAAAVPATPVAPPLLNAALASTVPATPAPAARTGRTDAASRDTAATAVAAAIGAEKLVVLSDIPGVLRDVNDPESLIHSLTASEARRLIADGTIASGMIPKIEGCLETLERGVKKIHIIDGRLRHSLLLEIYTTSGVGTEVTRDTAQASAAQSAAAAAR